MKKLLYILLSLCLYILAAPNSHAQTGWQWGAGCTGHAGVGVNPVSEGWPVAADRYGNVFAGGAIVLADSTSFGPFTVYTPGGVEKMFIAKLDSSGHYQWVLSSLAGNPEAVSMVTDSAGDLYVLALYTTDSCSIGAFTLTQPIAHDCMNALIKISSSGTVLWAVNVSVQSSSVVNIGVMGIDGSGNIYVGNTFKGTFTIGATTLLSGGSTPGSALNVFVAKYDPSGVPVWAKSFIDNNTAGIAAMAVSERGTIYMTGIFKDTLIVGGFSLVDTLDSAFYLPYLVKLDSSGHVIWANRNTQHRLHYDALATDHADRVYLAADFTGDIVFGSSSFTPSYPLGSTVLVACLDSSSAVAWARAAYDTTRFFYNTPTGIGVDYCGRVFVTGGFEASVSTHHPATDFLLFATDTLHMPAGNYDPLFVAVYDTLGNYLASSAIASGGEDQNGSCIDNRGNVFLCSDNTITMVVGSDTLSAVTGTTENFFVAKYQYDVCNVATEGSHTLASLQQDVSLYPNPAFESCVIKSSQDFSSGATAELYDVQGRHIATYPLRGNAATISLSGISPGMYFCRILHGDGSNPIVKKLVVE